MKVKTVYVLNTVPMKADGNCLFRSLSYWLYGTEDRHAEIRNMVCQWLSSPKNWAKVSGFMPDMAPGEDPEHAALDHAGTVERMARIGTWSNEFEVMVAAEVLQRTIHVYYCYDKARGEATLFSSYPENSSSSLPPLVVTHSVNHYDVVTVSKYIEGGSFHLVDYCSSIPKTQHQPGTLKGTHCISVIVPS